MSYFKLVEDRITAEFAKKYPAKQIDPMTILMLISLAVAIARCYLEWRSQQTTDHTVSNLSIRQRFILRSAMNKYDVPIRDRSDFTELLMNVATNSTDYEIEKFIEETDSIKEQL